MTFWELLASAPEREVLRDDHGRSLTTRQLADAAERVAAGLDVAPGTRVSWQVPTTLEALVLQAALARVGAVQNPIIPILREREVGLITAQSGTELFVCPSTWRGFDHAGMARSLGLDVLELDLDGEVGPDLRLPTGDPAALPPPPTSDDECRWLYFSSGTTAAPKGGRHTDATLISSARGMNEHLGIGDGDVYPIAFPITHIGGITMLASVLRAGGVLLLLDTWDPVATPERIAAHRPTILGSAPPFFRAFLDAQKRHGDEPLFPDLRTCTGGGALIPTELVREIREVLGVGLVCSWGLTEFPIAACSLPDDPPDVQAETVGKATPGVEVRIVEGELRLKGPQCFLGYLDASLDADAFDEDGWFRTGDLGSIDDDGNIRITGRLKDVIIRNAENISATEIEDTLLRHPAVVDVAVIGLPDGRTGERVCAVVALAEGRSLTLADVAAHCQAQGLARQKCPEQLEVVDAVPRNPMGKALKQDLKARFGG